MTLADHEARCQKPLWIDQRFREDCRHYGVILDRLYCLDGHTVYFGPLPAPKVTTETVQCVRCPTMFTRNVMSLFIHCPACRELRRLAQSRTYVQRPCRRCGETITGRRPQARYHEACRKQKA